MELENIEMNSNNDITILKNDNLFNYINPANVANPANAVNIIANEIHRIYNEFNYDKDEYFDYFFYNYMFTKTFKCDIIVSIYKKKINMVIRSENIAYCDIYDYLFSYTLNIKKNDFLENIKLIIEKTLNIKNNFSYSKILNSFEEKEKLENKEQIYLAKKFICHQPFLENCCVCYEPNSTITGCNHNLCKICYFTISYNKNHPNCPICRRCLACFDDEDHDEDHDDYHDD